MGTGNSGATPLSVEAVIAQVEEEYAQAIAQPRVSPDAFSIHLRRQEQIVDSYIDKILAAIPSTQIKELIELIRKRRSVLFLNSGLKSEIVGISKQILSFGVAGLALSLGFSDRFVYLPVPAQKAIIIGGIFYVDMVIVSLLVLVLYTAQGRFRYPFLYFDRIGNTWPSFYYGSISGDVPRSPIQPFRQRIKGATRYAQDFLRFANKVATETEQQTLRAELQQYFLLLAYSGYAHQFSLRLANLFVYGVGWSVFTCGVLVTLAILR